jgi:hypothetical protein
MTNYILSNTSQLPIDAWKDILKLGDKTIIETSGSIPNIDDNKEKDVKQNKYKFDVEQMSAPSFLLQGATTLKEKKAPYRTIFATKSKPLKKCRKNLRHVQNHCHDLGNFF